MKNFSKYCWPIFFLLLGIISILGQTVILREITSLFYGNEMFYGLGLGLWLLLTGLGSFFALKFKLTKKPAILWISQIGLVLLLPILIILLRFIAAGLIPVGQLPDFSFSLVIIGIILFIFCFPLGIQFTLAAAMWSAKKGNQAANLSYFWETVGFTLGGLLFSFILATTTFPLPSALNRLTLHWHYPGLTSTLNSKYNQIVITKKDIQQNFFTSGQLAFSTQERYETQHSLSLIIPFTKEVNSILVFGNPNLAAETKNRFPNSNVDYLEIDSELLRFEKDLLGKEINQVAADPRRFLQQSKKQWDLIIFSPSNPQTLLANRYFTQESHRLVQTHLSPNGIFVLSVYLPTDYQSEEAMLFGRSIFQTLKVVFPKIELFTPEDQLMILAGQKDLKIDNRQIDPVLKDYFWYQINNPKRQQILSNLSATDVKLNLDSDPVAFFYQQLFWQTMFSFKIPRLLVKGINTIPLFLLIILLISLGKLKKQPSLGLLMAISSFILMSLEILIIFMFQTKIGYLYSQISLIFAAVLSGMAVGVMATKAFKKSVFALRMSFLGYLIVLLIFLLFNMTTIALLSGFWLGMAFVTGLFGGISYTSLNNLYLKKGKHFGYIYAFDLFGGCLGAILTSGFLLPFFGLKGLTLGLIIIVLAGLTSRHPG